MESMIKSFHDGGLFMYPILALLFIEVVIIAERLYMVLYVYEANAPKFMKKLQRYILDNNLDEAIRLTNSKKHSALYQVCRAALVNAERPFDEVQDNVEVASLGVVPKLQQRMPYLFTIANGATLLGLLGTVIGLIATFEAVGAVEGTQKQVLLSAGISTAMNTTAFGLIVAIPGMLVYGFLFNRINHIVNDIEHYSSQLLLLLRTGREYFDNFDSEAGVTTEQIPKRKITETNNDENVA